MIVNVGPYCVTTIGDEIAVTDVNNRNINLEDTDTYTYFGKVAGFAKFCAWPKGIAVVLTKVEDMRIINFVRKGTRWGEGYSLNLTVPYFSEYGDTGLVR